MIELTIVLAVALFLSLIGNYKQYRRRKAMGKASQYFDAYKGIIRDKQALGKKLNDALDNSPGLI